MCIVHHKLHLIINSGQKQPIPSSIPCSPSLKDTISSSCHAVATGSDPSPLPFLVEEEDDTEEGATADPMRIP
jgi:hypothetical protein